MKSYEVQLSFNGADQPAVSLTVEALSPGSAMQAVLKANSYEVNLGGITPGVTDYVPRDCISFIRVKEAELPAEETSSS